MQLFRLIVFGTLALLISACGSATPARPIFDDMTVPTRQPASAGNGEISVVAEGSGTVFPIPPIREIELDTPVSESLTNDNYAWVFEYQAAEPQRVDVSMSGRDGTLDTFLILLGPDGAEIARNDDRSDTRNDALLQDVELREAGTYYIVGTRWRQRYGADAGDFSLEIREADETERPTPRTRPINYEETIVGELDDQRFEDTYSFYGEAGDLVDITAFAAGNSTDDLDPSVTLTDSVGNELASNDDINPLDNFDAGISNFKLPYTGHYTVLTSRYLGEDGDTSGEYELTVENVGRDNGPTQFAYMDANQSVTLTEGENGLLDYGFFVGDISLEAPDLEAQTILTFYLPPLDREIGDATLDLSSCDEDGLGFGAVEAINVYAEELDGRIDSLTAYTPGNAARLLRTMDECDTVDVTALVREQYEAGANGRLQFRLLPQSTIANNEDDAVVILSPQLRLNPAETD